MGGGDGDGDGGGSRRAGLHVGGTCVPCWRPDCCRDSGDLDRDPWTEPGATLERGRGGSVIGNGMGQCNRCLAD